MPQPDAGKELLERVGIQIGIRCVLAHLTGALLAAVSSALTGANIKGQPTAFTGVDAVTLGAYLAITLPVGTLWGIRCYKRATAWLLEERIPTGAELRLLLTYPGWNAAVGMAGWSGAAVIFSLLTGFSHPFAYTARVALSILLGGLATSALSYLLVEWTLRPIVALALAADVPERPMAPGVRTKLLVSWALGADVFLVMIGLTFVGRPAHQPPSAAAIWFLVDAGVLTGTLVLYVAARSLADPLRELRLAVSRVQRGDLDVEVAVNDGGEVGLLQAGFNRMVVGLRERHQLQDLFGRHVGEDVARLALQRGVEFKGERREVGVLFVDLIGSTALTQSRPADDVVDLLNQFFATIVRVVAAEGGWVNKFEGDGALCVFGAPAAVDDYAVRALRAARTIRRELLAMSAVHAGLDAAIGVSAGTVVAGNVGTEQRYEYTVIGNPVNEASRLTDEAKQRLGRVLASEEVIARAEAESARWMVADELHLRGRSEPILVYEPAVAAADRTINEPVDD
jgi:adenylate cyclase